MNRKKAIIILSSVWLVAFVSLVYSWLNEYNHKMDIVTAFATGDYLSTNGVVEVYADYGNKYLSEEDKEKIITNLAEAMGIRDGLDFQSKREKQDGKYTSTTSFSTSTNYSDTDIRIVTIESEDGEKMMYLEQYILMEISIDDSIESVVYYRDKIEDALSDMKIAADVSLSLKGCVQGTLSNSKKNQICEKLIEDLNGTLVIGGENDSMYTVYAYSDDIEDYVINGTVKSNINIMITYDKNQDISWIQVGTPILN